MVAIRRRTKKKRSSSKSSSKTPSPRLSRINLPSKLRGNVVALDVETDGLNPYLGHRIFGFAYCTNKGETAWVEKTPEAIAWVAALLADPTKTVVFHNGKFDLKMFSFEGIDVFSVKATVLDTMTMAKVLYSTSKGFSLRQLAVEFIPNYPTDDKDEVELWIKEHSRAFKREHGRKPNFSDAPRDIVERRALWDVRSTLLLHRIFAPEVARVCPDLSQTEHDLIFVCIDMENTGVLVDVTHARQLRDGAQRATDRILADLRSIVGSIEVERTRKGEKVIETVDEFNPGSNQHLAAAFTKLGIRLRFKTKPKKNKNKDGKTGGGNWSFDEYAMIRYVPKPLAGIIRESGEDGWDIDKFYDEVYSTAIEHKLPKRDLIPPLVLKYREVTKMISTYYNHLIDDVVDRYTSPKGREYGTLHCKFNPAEAMTGRFSSSGPNLQNMPRLLGPRECFVPRKGAWNWHLDYSQVEMRMFVHFAEDKVMAAAIDNDIHREIASRIYRVDRDDVTKEQRKRGKATGFGVLYGSGGETQAETLTKRGLPTSTAEGEMLVNSFHREFPSVRRLTNKLKDELRREGYVTNPFGRRYHIPDRFSYKALNYMCQGTSADIIKAAMVKIWKWLRKSGLRTKMVMTIHDEVVLQVPKSEMARVIPMAKRMMEHKTNFFVPVTVDAEVNKTRWSEKKDADDLDLPFALSA